MTRAGAAIALVALVAAPAPARAAWRFANVVDSSGPYAQFTAPAINDAGQISTRASLDGGGQAILVGDGAGVVELATTAGPFSVFLTQTSISDTVAVFNAELDAGGTGIFVGPTPLTDTIASTNETFLNVRLPAIDAAGNVVFGAALAGSGLRGIFRGTEPIVDDEDAFDFFGRPALNDAGIVAFQASFDGASGTGVFTAPLAGGTAADTIADTAGPFASIDQWVALNDAGTVVFPAVLDGGASGLYTGPDPVVDRVVDTSGPFSQFFEPAITEDGTVIFQAFVDAGGGGIYAGPDPVADKVIAGFDPLFGSITANVNFRSEGYADGRIAFSYTLTDGRNGVAVAFVPEPRGAASALTAGAALLALRGATRRRAGA